MKIKLYYANARLNGKTSLLAGPFLTSAEAEHCLDIVGPMATEADPKFMAATFGVMECSKHAGFGSYNMILKAGGINVEVPTNSH